MPKANLIRSMVVLTAVTFALLPAAVSAQTVVQNTVPPATITDLFQFDTPTGAGAERIVVAKFVVDNTAADLELRLLMPSALQDFKISDGNVTVLDPNTAEPMATLRLRDLAVATPAEVTASPSYRIIKATIRFADTYNFGASEQWTIQAKPLTSAVRYIGYWHQGTGEAAVEAVVTRPRLIELQANLTDFASYTPYPSAKNISFGEVHISLNSSFVPERQWQFANVGTGPLNITAASPTSAPSGAYTIENYPSPPLTILPMGVFSRRITAQPTSLGPVPNVSLTLTATAPASNLILNLTNTTGIRLSSAILFDLSGSMLSDKNGSSTTDNERRKIWLARIAALELVQLYREILPEARLSLYTYPNGAGTCPSSQQPIPWNTIQNNLESFRLRLDAGLGSATLINPASASAQTPMAEGISAVYNSLADRGQHERAAVFLFGDGEHNCNSSGPRPTPASWYTWTTFRNARIPFFTIPYGATHSGWIQTFQALASNTGGEAFPADVTNDLQLQTQFKKALGKALDLETLLDPIASVSAGQVREHSVCVSESADQAVFSVHWATRNPQAISFTLRDPSGVSITPATGASGADVSFVSGQNYANYVLRGGRLAGANGAGEWTLRVQGNVATSYSYQVYAKDAIKVEPQFQLPGVMIPGQLRFQISEGDRLLQNVDVSASFTAPAASLNNFLATTHVSRALIDRVPEHIGQGSSRLAERKLYALTHFTNTPPPLERTAGQINFLRQAQGQQQIRGGGRAATVAPTQIAAQDLVYYATLDHTRFAGLYDLEVQIRGTTKLGSCFQRHFVISRWMDVALTPALVAGAVRWESPYMHEFLDTTVARIVASEPRAGFERRFIRFTPRDEHGNYIGLDRADEITLAVRGAEKLGALQNFADGSYGQLVEFRTGANPTVQASVGEIAAPRVSLRAERRIPWWLWLLLALAAAAGIKIGIL